jgi:hypothetical protein
VDTRSAVVDHVEQDVAGFMDCSAPPQRLRPAVWAFDNGVESLTELAREYLAQADAIDGTTLGEDLEDE